MISKIHEIWNTYAVCKLERIISIASPQGKKLFAFFELSLNVNLNMRSCLY